jgi:hypothetical protein
VFFLLVISALLRPQAPPTTTADGELWTAALEVVRRDLSGELVILNQTIPASEFPTVRDASSRETQMLDLLRTRNGTRKSISGVRLPARARLFDAARFRTGRTFRSGLSRQSCCDSVCQRSQKMMRELSSTIRRPGASRIHEALIWFSRTGRGTGSLFMALGSGSPERSHDLFRPTRPLSSNRLLHPHQGFASAIIAPMMPKTMHKPKSASIVSRSDLLRPFHGCDRNDLIDVNGGVGV